MSEHEVAQANTEVQESAEVTTKVIEVDNPTVEEMAGIKEEIQANFNFNVDVKSVEFKFKKSVDKESGIETVRKPVVLGVPYPSVQGVIDILETGGKGLELLMEALEGVVNTAARNLLYDNTELTAATFPVDQLSWEHLANMPKAQRRGGGIPKEVWEAFAGDYISVMPELTGKTVAQVEAAAKIILSKFNNVRTNKPVLNLMVEQLSIYAEGAANVEEYAECLEFLLEKADGYLNLSDTELLSAL